MVRNIDGFISIVKNPNVSLTDGEDESFILYSRGMSENNIYPPIGFRIKSVENKFVVDRRYLFFNDERDFEDLPSATHGLIDFVNETAERTKDGYLKEEGLNYIIIGEIKDFRKMLGREIYSSDLRLGFSLLVTY